MIWWSRWLSWMWLPLLPLHVSIMLDSRRKWAAGWPLSRRASPRRRWRHATVANATTGFWRPIHINFIWNDWGWWGWYPIVWSRRPRWWILSKSPGPWLDSFGDVCVCWNEALALTIDHGVVRYRDAERNVLKPDGPTWPERWWHGWKTTNEASAISNLNAVLAAR